jgi:hypothetical protein
VPRNRLTQRAYAGRLGIAEHLTFQRARTLPRAATGAGVEGWPAHNAMTSPWLARRTVAALMTSHDVERFDRSARRQSDRRGRGDGGGRHTEKPSRPSRWRR